MRTKPIVGRKVWFGPRRYAWGWSPITAAGWAVLVAGVGAAIVLATTVSSARWLSLVAVAVMLAIIFLKGTSPGGLDEWYEFRAARDGNRGPTRV